MFQKKVKMRMNNKDYLKDIYRDFFGVEDIKKDPIGDEQSQKKESNNQEEMSSLFDEINQLYRRFLKIKVTNLDRWGNKNTPFF